LSEDDRDVAAALLNAGGASHGARPPATEEAVGGFVDESGLDKERIEVDARALRAGVRHRALDELLDDGCRRFLSKFKYLKRFACLFSTDQIDDDPGFAGRDARKACDRFGDHGLSLSFPRRFRCAVVLRDRSRYGRKNE